MPELPEVQTIVDDLRGLIRGWTVADFSSLWKKNVYGGEIGDFKKAVIGKKVVDVSRRAKYILIELDNEVGILVHLRMTGALLVKKQETRNKKQTNSKFKIQNSKFTYIRHGWLLMKGENKKCLLFSDVRKFGTIDLVDLKEIENHKSLCKLGAEPLADIFTVEALGNILSSKKKQTVRSVLLDQSAICGIGNIYVSEILFDSRISPARKAQELTRIEVVRLHKSIRKILKNAIESRGTTFSDYRDSKGAKGGFQNKLKVYNREREKCLRKRCQGAIKKQKIGQRSAYWCPVCQK